MFSRLGVWNAFLTYDFNLRCVYEVLCRGASVLRAAANRDYVLQPRQVSGLVSHSYAPVKWGSRSICQLVNLRASIFCLRVLGMVQRMRFRGLKCLEWHPPASRLVAHLIYCIAPSRCFMMIAESLLTWRAITAGRAMLRIPWAVSTIRLAEFLTSKPKKVMTKQ